MQLTLNFEPGLSERHSSLKSCIRERVYANPKPLKVIASDMDLSESDLSRKLADNPNDARNLTVEDFERYMDATGDYAAIYYLIEKYAISNEAKRAHASSELAKLLPQVLALAKQMDVQQKTKAR